MHEFYNDDNKDKDKANKKKSKFNRKAYKHAISMVESSGGKNLETPIDPETGKNYSSASGNYHFLYESIRDDPDMDGISMREFINRPELQEKIMDKALDGTLKGYSAYGENYANKLKEEYGSDRSVNEIAAMVHFVGPGGTRKFLKDPENYKPPGKVNMTGDEYLGNFTSHFDKYVLDNPEKQEPRGMMDNPIMQQPSFSTPPIQDNSRMLEQPRDNIKFKTKDLAKMTMAHEEIHPSQNVFNQNLNGENPKHEEANSFKEGGEINNTQGSASDLVTMFEGGGKHEENPLGGIPVGKGPNGKPNLVEEGETKWEDYIFSNVYDMDGNYSGGEGKKENVFEEGGDLINPTYPPKGKKPVDPDSIQRIDNTSTSRRITPNFKEKDPSKPSNQIEEIEKKEEKIGKSSFMTTAMRELMPLPNNGSQLLSALINEDSTYTTRDSSKKSNEHLYRSVRNAIKRTGKNSGGTEYEDYSDEIAKDINSLKANALDMAAGSVLSPEVDAATAFGRVSYKQDPETGKIKVYDSYDFSKTPGGDGLYKKIRSFAGEASEGRLDSSPKLIGEFDLDEKKKGFMDKVGDFSSNVVDAAISPIDAMNFSYGDVKKGTQKVKDAGNYLKKGALDAYEDASSTAKDLYNTASKSGSNVLNSISSGYKSLTNLFEEGGSLKERNIKKRRKKKTYNTRK